MENEQIDTKKPLTFEALQSTLKKNKKLTFAVCSILLLIFASILFGTLYSKKLKTTITKEEGLKLQSLEGLALPPNDNPAFKALGNAVNSKIVKLIAEKLLNENHKPKQLNSAATQHSQQLSILQQHETAW